MSYVYLTSPPDGDKVRRFVSDILESSPYVIYSPVVFMDSYTTTDKIWERLCRAMLKPAHELWVLTLPGWRECSDVLRDIAIAKEKEIPIRHINTEGEFCEELS